ncbi:MAG: SixA phosphatase family protein, partial [Chitinophagaceae bacterium]
MKQLLLIRHAKSSWSMNGLSDFERPLNERGHNDAPTMASRLLKNKIAIDAFISSTANRAFTTAIYFYEIYTTKFQKIPPVIGINELYHAPASIFYQQIALFNNNFQSVAVFAHNPGITEFVNELTDVRIDDMPTCGIFCMNVACSTWSDFKTAKKTFLFFD